MGRLAAALLLAASAGIAAAQERRDAACDGIVDLEEMLTCRAAKLPPRPLDKEPGKACTGADGPRFVRPVEGRRVLGYGDKTQYGSHSKGVVFETRSAAQVLSAAEGFVIYAGEFRSYGKLLVVELDCGLRILMAGPAQIDVAPGQYVLAGEPVGVMSVVPGDRIENAPVLYVELRREGRPIDPGPDIAGQ